MVPTYWNDGGTCPTTIPTYTTQIYTNCTAATTMNTWLSPGTYWIDSQTGRVITTGQTASWYLHALERPRWVDWRPSAPAIMSHQELTRRDEELYRRAVAECNEQEATRIRLLIEHREQTAAAQRAAQEAQQQQARERQEVQNRANARATELLMEHLTPEQRKTCKDHGWFIVEGGRSKQQYRINTRSAAGNIDIIGSNNRLCCHAPYDRGLPKDDHLLAQKLMLQFSEDDFLRIANRH